LVDTNLFIATIKNPKKETTSLRLLLDMIDDTTIALIGNEFLIIDKTEVVEVDEKFLRICKLYFPEDELIDIYHAATCLQEGAILITNDRHFDKIKDEKIIEVWSISMAIAEFGI